MNVSKYKIDMCGLFSAYVFKRDGSSKNFLMEFDHSGMYSRYLKCPTSVFRKPDNCCLCLSSRITRSLVIFARESDSLVKYSVTV